ncbi:hypothetical protein EMIT0196P_20137 [Pseudomonas chlororaphis]
MATQQSFSGALMAFWKVRHSLIGSRVISPRQGLRFVALSLLGPQRKRTLAAADGSAPPLQKARPCGLFVYPPSPRTVLREYCSPPSSLGFTSTDAPGVSSRHRPSGALP